MALKDTYDKKDPQVCTPDWPWSLPRSVMRARYGVAAGEPRWEVEEPETRTSDYYQCDPVPIYIAECARRGIKPRQDMVDTLARMWNLFLKRNRLRDREPGQEG